ncbi:ATP-grasp domain-containing protein [Actinophytocola sp.]|uniref:ATP-grasp domain-containing protein n=1 Tax=Actinophytocola sp. TaxID=1872138 RepID=UPI002D7FCB95|nr:ATP-grasp domain-containing protein [Actinophytocola sp.]HET9137749.1 ATP-grasp domain-containing protein [Actinophytocola sp.]
MADKPIVIVGFVATALSAFAQILPDHSVIFVEEPDVIRKRQVRDKIAGAGLVRDLIAWEFHLPGKADEFHQVHGDLNPAAVVPLTEYATPFAARLAERLGLPGAGLGAAQILRDKELLRRVSAAAGIANPEMVRVDGPADVLDFLRGGSGPIVLKPANRQASVGTQVIHEPAQVEAAWASCVVQDEGVYVPDRVMELRMLAERYVEGSEYSVEMLVRAGDELFVNVTGKQLFPGPRPVELGHVVPADIAPELAGTLAAETRRVVAAVGFGDGIVHCEWIVSDGIPYLVECAGRFAGDGIIELIQRAYPVELNRAYFALMKGEPLPEVLPCRAAGAAAVRFLSIEPGVVADVRGVEEAERAAGVVHCDVSIAAGQEFAGLRSSWDRVGDVMVTADNPAQAQRLAEAAADLIRIEMRPAERPAELATAAS